jgi:hypothetical protein
MADPQLVASFSDDAASSAETRRATAEAVGKGRQQCAHEFAQHFGGEFSCACCWKPLADVADPGRIAAEEQQMKRAQDEDAAVGSDMDRADCSFSFGVTVAWLIAFTVAHSCWNWSTRDVQAHVITPACEKSRKRYADLPHVRAVPGAVGTSDIFVSRELSVSVCIPGY